MKQGKGHVLRTAYDMEIGYRSVLKERSQRQSAARTVFLLSLFVLRGVLQKERSRIGSSCDRSMQTTSPTEGGYLANILACVGRPPRSML